MSLEAEDDHGLGSVSAKLQWFVSEKNVCEQQAELLHQCGTDRIQTCDISIVSLTTYHHATMPH